MKGGKLAVGDLKNLLNASYETTPQDVGDWKVDKSLSGQRVQVYQNDKTGQVVVDFFFIDRSNQIAINRIFDKKFFY